jgi:hypothetical protein
MKDNGGMVGPSTRYWDSTEGKFRPPEYEGGMTMRQWYKGMALAGYIANSEYTRNTAREIAKMASDTAEAMLAEDKEAAK